ncbi:EamA family transporter [Colwellia sp. 75C3]|uniref:DMT family transporter n=1 Tax=Colwellia sp. 75C3 TaxID=888425 RepID=UPI000C34F406|nr:DMT family transporter [Colwellia sp. 75C3]PKG84589.1 EamA family transporter [Colwellia sp. 75C3]
MSGALASFSILAIGARELSGELTIAQSLCIRSAIGLLFLSCVYFIQSRFFKSKRLKATSTQLPVKVIKLHLFRNLFHFIAQYGWFFGIGLLPLAEVFALEFTVPIWTLLIASFFLNEKVTKNKLLAIFLGTLGVLAIVRPGYALIDYASIVVLGSAICFAISHTTTKSLATTESPLTILLFMCIIQLPIGLLLSLSHWVWPQGEQWLWLTVIGISALSAHYCLAKAMQYAEVTTIITLDFFRLPLIATVGVLFYNEAFEMPLLIGGALMLVGNLIGVRDLTRKKVTIKENNTNKLLTK